MNVACLCDIWMVQEQDLENEKRQEKKKHLEDLIRMLENIFLSIKWKEQRDEERERAMAESIKKNSIF